MDDAAALALEAKRHARLAVRFAAVSIGFQIGSALAWVLVILDRVHRG